MTGNFINVNNFSRNIVNDYNKLLSENMNDINSNLGENSMSEFDSILNQQMGNYAPKKLEASIHMDTISSASANPSNIVGNTHAEKMMNDFKNAFGSGLNSVNQKQMEAQRATEIFATGGDIDIHEVMIAAEKSSLSMQMALQMRNKMLSFYNEIKSIQV